MTEAKANPVGRPTKYRPEYCDEIVETCREGHSITGFAGKIGVSRDCLTKWGQDYPEFLLALARAKAAAAYGIEVDANRVRKVGGGPGAATMCVFQLKNFAGDDYKEKTETATTIANPDGSPVDRRTVIILPDNGRD